MDISIKVEAPDLAKAIMALAEAIGWYTATQQTTLHLSGETLTTVEQPPEQPQPELAPPDPTPVNLPAAVSAAKLQQKAAELIRKGKRELVVGIVSKYGAGKISEVAEDKRADCLAELEALEGA